MEASFDYSETLSNVLFFHYYKDDAINKKQRTGPKGYPAFRMVGSAEIVDLEGDIIDLQALAEVMPIMKKQGARIQGFHTHQPAGEWFDWGFMKRKGVDCVWVDVEIYDDYPTQKENLRRILLPKGHKDRINGLSLGGFKLAKRKECDELRCWTRIVQLEGWEFSIVGKMANPLAENIEDEYIMEFDNLNLNKKQPREKDGRFSFIDPPVQSISTTTITTFDNNIVASIDTPSIDGSGSLLVKGCECEKHLDKGEYSTNKRDENKDEDEELEEDTKEAIEGEEEIEERLDDDEDGEEPIDEGQGEPPSEPAEQPQDVGQEILNQLDTLFTALNIDKTGEQKMTPQTVEIDGKKYVKKDGNFIPYVEETVVEIEGNKFVKKDDGYVPYVEATDNTEVGSLQDLETKLDEKISKNFETLADKFMEQLKGQTTIEASSLTEDPATVDKEVKKDGDERFYTEGATVEQRIIQSTGLNGSKNGSFSYPV